MKRAEFHDSLCKFQLDKRSLTEKKIDSHQLQETIDLKTLEVYLKKGKMPSFKNKMLKNG